ncbi:MAG: hypothetical protein KC420_03110, partial [Myxococcales bacterium]|nr:hypothetical protein [Myxococcales bacterium]
FLAHLILPADVAGVSVGEHKLDAGAIRSGPKGSKIVTIYAPPSEGVALTLEVGADALTLVDAVPGLPPAEQAVADARGPDLVASQWGDLSVAHRTFTP